MSSSAAYQSTESGLGCFFYLFTCFSCIFYVSFHDCTPTASESQLKPVMGITQSRESLSHYLKDDLSFTISGVTLHQCQVLPGADRDFAVHKGNRDKWGHDQGMNMG